MRTDDSRPRSVRTDAHPLRTGMARLRNWLAEFDPRTRLYLAALAVALLLAAGYFAANSPAVETETAWLFESQSLPQEEARRIFAALATAKIPASLGPHGQIAVPGPRKADALALLAKQKLLPVTLREIQNEAANPSILAFSMDRGQQRDQVSQREAEIMIGELEGIELADVRIHRSTSRAPGQRAAKLAALVRVQTRDDRPITHQTLQAIQSILKSTEPDLTPDALTILDKSGKPYLVAGNPEVGAAMMVHVLEDELRSELLVRLNWIGGVRVQVTLESPVEIPAPVAPAAPAVVMNGAAEIAEVAAPLSHPAPTAPVPANPGRARILVQVPITHYFQSFQLIHRREATLDELKPHGLKVDETIRSAIQNYLPAPQVASLKIDRIDAPGPILPPISSVESPSIRLPNWLIPAASGASVSLVILVLIGTRWMATRRPAAKVAPVPRAHFEVTDEAGPSGRVRDLVRRDPAAAAGVLGRWIGQGGPSS